MRGQTRHVIGRHDRGRIEQVIIIMAGDFRQEPVGVHGEQAAGSLRTGSGRQQKKVWDGSRNNGLVPRALLGQNFGQARFGGHRELLVQDAAPEIRVHQQDAGSGVRQRDGEIGGHG